MLGQLQHGPVALAAGRTVEAVGPVVVDPLVVPEVPGEAEGLPAQVAHVTLLTVDSHVVAKGHVVGVGLAAEVTPGFWQERRNEWGWMKMKCKSILNKKIKKNSENTLYT